MKLVKKIVPVVLSLTMCVSLVAPALAVDIDQEFIDQCEVTTEDNISYVDLAVKKDAEGNVVDNTFNMTGDISTGHTLRFKGGDDVVLNMNGYTLDHQDAQGSVIRAENTGLTINGADEDGNMGTITGGNATAPDDTSLNNGGGIYSINGDLTLNDVCITDNTAKTNGGAVWAQATGADKTQVTMNNVVVEDNKVTGTGGGAVCLRQVNADLTNIVINNNEAGGAAGGIGFAMCGDVNVTDAKITNNVSAGNGTDPDNAANDPNPIGGGVVADGTDSIFMENVIISGNEVHTSSKGMGGLGGGMHIYNCGEVTLSNSEISGNTADLYGGGMYIYSCGKVTLNDSKVSGNTADAYSGGIFCDTTTILMNDGSVVANNTAAYGADDIYANNVIMRLPSTKAMNEKLDSDGKNITGWYYDAGERWSNGQFGYHGYHGYESGTFNYGGRYYLKAAHDPYFNVIYKDGMGENDGAELEKAEVENGSAIPGYSSQDPTREGYEFVGWRLADNSEVDFESGIVSGDLVLVAQWREADNSGIEIPEPEIPLGPGPGEIEIEDEEVPLAGLFTRGDAIGYLWEKSGSPEWELSDFEDVPEDHQWAVAIGWAQDMGIAVADLEGNFRPDDLVLHSVEDIELSPEGELQEFLNRYAVYAGIELEPGELFIELDGAWDDIVMGEDAQVIFDDFFAKLEAALAQAA